MKRNVITVLLCVILCFSFPHTLHAEEVVSNDNGLDIIFAIDCSGSMKTNDPDRIGMGMVKAFIDTVHTEAIRVGYVAYNDGIVSSSSPVSISDMNERQNLKNAIDGIGYSGDTDIGLGLTYAHNVMPDDKENKRVIVLISDGETDLKGKNGRTIELSNQELAQCIENCQNEEIQIYTIAFGAYEGNQEVLENIAAKTDAESYSAKSPQDLIEVLYGIYDKNLSYKIQQLSSGSYAGGDQEIRCYLDEPYLDEMDVLVISSGKIGETTLQYGEKEIPTTNLSNYAVGKIGNDQIEDDVKELLVKVHTSEQQNLHIHLISYRKMMPVLDIEKSVPKKQNINYSLYFKDGNGNIIRDEAFYKRFKWTLQDTDPEKDHEFYMPELLEVSNGTLQGMLYFKRSGTFNLNGILTDSLGDYTFDIPITVFNNPPEGILPVTRCTILNKEISYDLNDYFTDKDGDELQFSVDQEENGVVSFQLEKDVLTIVPKKSGTQMVTLSVNDDDSTLSYRHQIEIIPLWKAYWWVILISLAALAGILWKLLYKPRPVLEQIAEEKKSNRFCGKLDLYFTKQPESDEEMPPLSFQMHKIKDSKVTLGNLLREYQEASDALGLDEIYLIADVDRRMVLYHTSDALVMLGNSIVCRQIQYSVSFGDVIYITSQDGAYDMEVHYIAMIQ